MRAKPMLTYGLVAGALALPGPALALGLGKLTVDSSLGQPLSARIELTSATKDEIDSLSARVADPGLYRQNNLTYQGALSRTRITLENVSGTPYLRVTSPVSVQEPFLDLMVELNWASGRVVREYTFLLDPPGSNTAVAAADPVTPARVGTAPRAPAVRAEAAPAVAAAPSAGGTPADGSYAVKRGDTLSKIAAQVKPAEITLDQMLVAMFRANENAFEGRNMNRLRTGTILAVPSAADAGATQSVEATKLVRVQSTDWRSYRDRVASNAPVADSAGTRESGGRIGTAVTEATPAATPGRDQIRVSREARTGRGAAGEDSVAQGNQLREAQARIAQLEKMVQDMQRTLDLRNPTLAAAQSQADAARAKSAAPAAAAPTTSVAAPISTPPASTATPPPVVAAAPAPVPTPAVAAPVVVPPVVSPAPVDTKAADAAKSDANKDATAPVIAPAVAPPVVAPPVVDASKSTVTDKGAVPKSTKAKVAGKEPPGFFEDLAGNMPGWAIGLGALAILGGIAALFAARRRKTTKFEDSIISGTDIKTNTVFGSTGGGVVNTGDNSLASDFSREGLGNIDTDEVDPIAEAEVYLAYGRDAQAEEILKDALKKDPQRQEIYLKLLEIHAQHNKPSAFETVASELYAVSHGQGEVWHKAVALGRQLDPANPMFSEGGAPPPPTADRASETTLAMQPTLRERSNEPSMHPDRPLDNMIDEEISISPTSGARPKTPADILAGAEDAVERSRAPVASAERPRASAVDAAGAATAALAGALAASKASYDARADVGKEPKYDLDFHLDEADKPAPMKRVDPREPEMAIATATAAVGTAPSQLTRPAAALELDKLDLSFDPERSTFEDPTPSVLDGQWHDAATKLDLAKAYQEMGDLEGAREILQEVLHEGDGQQKSEAQALLGKLG